MRDAPAICFPLFRFAASLRRRLASAFSVSEFQVRRYFSSGWAFLIPYLAAYLLYYVLKWPVNTAAAGVKVKMTSESGMWVPCLLHVYWGLHCVNFVLAVIALRAWWKENSKNTGVRRARAVYLLDPNF